MPATTCSHCRAANACSSSTRTALGSTSWWPLSGARMSYGNGACRKWPRKRQASAYGTRGDSHHIAATPAMRYSSASAWPTGNRRRDAVSGDDITRQILSMSSKSSRLKPLPREPRNLWERLQPRALALALKASPTIHPRSPGFGRLRQQHRGRGGDVEAFDRAGAGDRQAQVAGSREFRVHALAFRAEHVHQPLRQARGEQVLTSTHHGETGRAAGRDKGCQYW